MYSIGVDWVTVNEILDFREDDVKESELKKMVMSVSISETNYFF